jgi:hypothetical protein
LDQIRSEDDGTPSLTHRVCIAIGGHDTTPRVHSHAAVLRFDDRRSGPYTELHHSAGHIVRATGRGLFGEEAGLAFAQKLLIDADPGIGDAVAVAVALFDPDIDLVGVTATAGCVSGREATRNLQAILDNLDPPCSKIPRCRACSTRPKSTGGPAWGIASCA